MYLWGPLWFAKHSFHCLETNKHETLTFNAWLPAAQNGTLCVQAARNIANRRPPSRPGQCPKDPPSVWLDELALDGTWFHACMKDVYNNDYNNRMREACLQ